MRHVAHIAPRVTLPQRFHHETIYFISVSVPSILNRHSLNILHFHDFSKNLIFGVHLTSVVSKFVKIRFILEFNEIRLGDYISQDDSND